MLNSGRFQILIKIRTRARHFDRVRGNGGTPASKLVGMVGVQGLEPRTPSL